MKKLFKAIGIFTVVYLALNVITPFNKHLRDRSIDNQINYLNKILNKGYDDKLQSIYPEGRIFSNALFSLAVIEHAQKTESNQDKYSKIIDKRVKRLLEKRTTAIFSEDMKPKYGAFYNGWINLVLNKYRASPIFEKSEIKELVNQTYNRLSAEMINAVSDSIQLLDTYPGAVWPGDNLVGIASLEDQETANIWLNNVYKSTVHPSGLIHHVGSRPEQIRGSSQALLLYMISQVDYDQAKKDDETFQELFVDSYLGVEMVREAERGEPSTMDIDSGPVILEYGAVATIMNIKTQAALKNNNSKKTWALMNVLGLPINIFNGKYYLFKKQPMFDIFMLWTAVEL